MRVEVALAHALEELHVHLLRHRRAHVAQEVVVIGKVGAEHEQLAALAQQLARQRARVELAAPCRTAPS